MTSAANQSGMISNLSQRLLGKLILKIYKMKNLNQNSVAAPRLTIHYFYNVLKINKIGGGIASVIY